MQRSLDELNAKLGLIRESPRDGGRVEAIVLRPARDARQEVAACAFRVGTGAAGDRWAEQHPQAGTPALEGMEDPQETRSQVTLMNARAADAVAGARDRWALAGDQLFVDLDLSEENLKAGDRLRIGSVEMEVTDMPHNGCRKFSARFGEAALAWVNSPAGKALHLRGIYVRVRVAGEVRIGDRIEKVGVRKFDSGTA